MGGGGGGCSVHWGDNISALGKYHQCIGGTSSSVFWIEKISALEVYSAQLISTGMASFMRV